MQLSPEWQGSRFCPGGYPYTDYKTGRVFDAMAGGLDDRVRQVQDHRRANASLYSASDLDAGVVRQQIIDFMCNRRPSLCGGTDSATMPNPNPAILLPTANCPSCGALDAKPEMCASCGGSRVKYWTCNVCGTKY